MPSCSFDSLFWLQPNAAGRMTSPNPQALSPFSSARWSQAAHCETPCARVPCAHPRASGDMQINSPSLCPAWSADRLRHRPCSGELAARGSGSAAGGVLPYHLVSRAAVAAREQALRKDLPLPMTSWAGSTPGRPTLTDSPPFTTSPRTTSIGQIVDWVRRLVVRGGALKARTSQACRGRSLRSPS